MEQLQWNERFSVGVGLIDNQHKKLFSIINDLIVAKENSQQQDVIEDILTELIAYTEYHFSSEEKLIKIHPKYEDHCRIHKNFVAKVAEQAEFYQSSKQDISDETLEFLINWLKNHVLKTDLFFFNKLKNQDGEDWDELTQLLPVTHTKEKILVVDDCDFQRELLVLSLAREGFEVLIAEDGVEALAICDAHTDLRFIITDINMPNMDGYELIRKIRQKQVHYIYIIVVTGMDQDNTVIEALSNGANDFLTKPVRTEELALRINGGRQLIRLETQGELIFSMAKLADYRSEETGLHLDRVQEYTLVLGLYLAKHHLDMGVTVSLANEISTVSPLHDIGKVGIVDNILKKPSRLTDEEFEIMKHHTLIGGELISEIYVKTKSLPMRLAFEITMYHHERWNGKGYPAGLSGNGIPISARITALADVYDALTTNRVYKKAFSHEKAKSIIVEEAGGHFDPRVVEAFLATEDKFQELKERLQDK